MRKYKRIQLDFLCEECGEKNTMESDEFDTQCTTCGKLAMRSEIEKFDKWFKRKVSYTRAFRFGYDDKPDWFYIKINENYIDYQSDDLCVLTIDDDLYGSRDEQVKSGDYLALNCFGDVIKYTPDEFIALFEPMEG